MKSSYLDYHDLIEILGDYASACPEREALIFLGDNDTVTTTTYARLMEISRQYAESLTGAGLERGDIAILLLPHSLEIMYAFFGGIVSGVVTSIYPYPALNVDRGKSAGMIKTALRDIRARAIITTPDLAGEFLDTRCTVLQIEGGFPVRIAAESPGLEAVRLDPRIAYLQLTSGTTGSSKGVLITHRNFLYFLESSVARKCWPFRIRASWIPIYHIGALVTVLTSLMSGMTEVLMPPTRWLVNPLSLFQVIDRYRADAAVLPNSGFVHAVKHVDDRELEKLDLSCLTSMTSGGEPVGAKVVEIFFDKFARAGLERKSFGNGYGLAEATALVSMSGSDETIHVDRIDGDLFTDKGIARKVASDFSGSVLSIVSCGPPAWGNEVKIVDNNGKPVPERQAGEVLVRSGGVFEGYHLDPELTAQTIRNGWLHTGDLGYLAEGELYVCDRKKDLIITGGKNVRPGDVEGIVYGEFPECSLCAAFGIYDEEIGTERLVLACEWSRIPEPREEVEIEKKARKQVHSGLSISLDDFRIVESGWIARTPTRKISRKATGDKYRKEFL